VPDQLRSKLEEILSRSGTHGVEQI
jgi:hypothetical protein